MSKIYYEDRGYSFFPSEKDSKKYQEEVYLPRKQKTKQILKTLNKQKIIDSMFENDYLSYEIDWNLKNSHLPWHNIYQIPTPKK